ncbi:MAG: ATP-binding protein [Lachnospiraceae bacterium]|nr:ATP-binding protein [Lachnospiraceae bacterium]
MRDETIVAVRDRLDDVLVWANELLEANACPRRVKVQLHVCVEELFVNICNYAYTPGKGEVHITMDVIPPQGDEPAVFWMELEDSGVPFDPTAHKDPDITLSAEERAIGGLGIFMVKKRMDSFTYRFENGKNISRIEKKLVA